MGALIRGSIGGRGSIGVALGEDGALEGALGGVVVLGGGALDLPESIKYVS